VLETPLLSANKVALSRAYISAIHATFRSTRCHLCAAYVLLTYSQKTTVKAAASLEILYCFY